MTRNLINQVTVIIRSIGERTESICRELIISQGVPDQALFIVNETPFSQAMRTSFRIGLECDRPWTFCIDADLLLRPGSIQRMLEIAAQQPTNVCEIQGLILDKFFSGPRPAGNHLYRTTILDRALRLIPEEGINIRPEHHTLQAMQAQGLPWINVPYLVGIHDFEQYYRDIFRKCLVQAHKHQHFTDLFLSVWRQGAIMDADYRVALAGFARGIEHYGTVKIDARDEVFSISLSNLGLDEKKAMIPEEWLLDRVERIINDWQESPIYLEKFPDRMGLNTQNSVYQHAQSRYQRVRQKMTDLGILRAIFYYSGGFLQSIGRQIQTFSLRD